MKNRNFLAKVSELFIENGAKSLTMDEVAKHFGVSKKTLYQKYATKDALLEDVLKFKLGELIEHFQTIDEKYDNALERMLCKEEELERASAANKSILLKQIIKYYPAVFNKHMHNFSDSFSEVLIKNIEKGREQGYYRTDFNAEMYSKLFFQMALSYDSSPFMEDCTVDRNQYMDAAMDFYLSAVTNENGKNYLKKLKNQYEQMV